MKNWMKRRKCKNSWDGIDNTSGVLYAVNTNEVGL